MTNTETELKEDKNVDKTLKSGRARSLENLKKAKPFTSENQPKNRRKKEVKTVLKEFRHDVSDEVVERIASVMLSALACKSTRDAQKRLKEAEEKEPEYGWIFEQTILDVKKRGMPAILDVLEWVFGKKTNLSVSGDLGVQMKPLVDLTKRKKNGGEK
jgi:hypothetical protein